MPSSNMHEDLSRKSEVVGSSARAFGLVFTAFLIIVSVWPTFGASAPRYWTLIAAAGLLAVTLLCPRWLEPLNRSWFHVGLLLNRIVGPLVLGVLFFLTITPTALVMRWLGKDLLRLRQNASADSYWIMRRPPGPAPDSLKNQF